jgi:hypothetical protein
LRGRESRGHGFRLRCAPPFPGRLLKGWWVDWAKRQNVRAEEIYHEGEEGARKAGIEGVFHSFVFPASRELALVRLCG